MLAEYNTDATDILENEEDWFVASGLETEFERILKALEGYDFTEATNVVEKIANNFQIEIGQKQDG